ncbi:MAG: TetR/AcrR family transcriptional regulator [Marmoricola sp.]|jgi:AcrR family transcriptional regulator|nr:TetR/AcrR family transcriptional regulator [Marmoricola sp.]
MARDATLTRSRLLRAGEQRFARDGVTGARMSDVVRDAGQANDAAVGYHFGSRRGLLEAIVAKHVQAMDGQREVPSRGAGTRALVDAIVRPTANLLATEDGRDFLRIMEQLADWSGMSSGHPAPPLRATVIGSQLEALTRRLGDRIGMPLARERVALMVVFLTGALAARARAVESGERQRMAHARFVDHLADVLTGALTATSRQGP